VLPLLPTHRQLLGRVGDGDDLGGEGCLLLDVLVGDEVYVEQAPVAVAGAQEIDLGSIP